jgi:hypothetical protein
MANSSIEKDENVWFKKFVAINLMTNLRYWDEASSVVLGTGNVTRSSTAVYTEVRKIYINVSHIYIQNSTFVLILHTQILFNLKKIIRKNCVCIYCSSRPPVRRKDRLT